MNIVDVKEMVMKLFVRIGCFLISIAVVVHFFWSLQVYKSRMQIQADVIADNKDQIIQLDSQVAGYQEIILSLCRSGKQVDLGYFTVTAYEPDISCRPFNDGITSVGLPAGRGIVAVDPRIIPYGAVIYIPDLHEYFFAADTGAAMKKQRGRNVDLLLRSVDEAKAFGRKRLKVELIRLGRR